MIQYILAFVAIAVVYVIRFYQNVKRYPKGPTPLPLIGNLHNFDWKKAHLAISELHKEYGNVFTIWLPLPYVCILDYENMKEAFSKTEDFTGRAGVFPDNIFQNMDNGGVIFSEGDVWKEQRRVSLHILRDFGMGKNLMENLVVRSVEDCLEHIRSLKSENGIDMRWPLQLFVGNVINKTLFNFSYKYDDCEQMKAFVLTLNKQIDEIKDSKLFFFAQMWPWFEHIPYIGYQAVGRFRENIAPMKAEIKRLVAKAFEDYNEHQEPECFVHAYKQKMASNSYLSDDQLLNVCMDFYLAGMETTTTTLRWAMLYMAAYPEVQDKIREEIKQVIGFSKLPTMVDKPKMPFTNATIYELQRMANIVPMNVAHRTLCDTQIAGQSIPENTLIIGLLSHVLSESPVYPDGDKFKPERFLLDDGVTPNKATVEQCIPFSIGKRVCAGEGLARVELFIGLVAILQHFKVEKMPGTQIDLEPQFSAVLLPKPQNLCLIPLQH